MFSLLAKSSALSKGILQQFSSAAKQKQHAALPDSFQMHGADLDNVPRLLALEKTISSSAGHACHVQKFCAVDHVIIWRGLGLRWLRIGSR